MTSRITEISPPAYARIAGVLYLIMFFAAIFSEFYVRSGMIVPGDPTATVNNITSAETLFRMSFVADFAVLFCDLGVSVLLYVLLRPVNQTLALVAAVARLIMTGMRGINLVNNLFALTLLGGASYLTVFNPDQLNALVLLFLDGYSNGFMLDLVFFSLHCLVLGYLLFQSGYFPKILGILMALAGLCYLANSFTNLLAPGYAEMVGQIIIAPTVIAELSLTLWLLIKGVNLERWNARVLNAG